MPTIGIDARMYAYTGIGRYIQQLIQGLHHSAVDYRFKLFLYPDVAESIVLDKRFEKILVSQRIYSLEEQVQLGYRFWKEQLDLLHVPHFNVPIFYPSKFVLTIHDITQTVYSSTGTFKSKVKKCGYSLATSVATKRAAKVIAVTETTRLDVIKQFHVAPGKVQVIYQGVPDLLSAGISGSFSSLASKFSLKKPYVLYVGLWGPHKNVVRLVEAVGLLVKKKPDLQLVLVGKKDERYFPELQAAVSRVGVEKNIVFTGFVTDEELDGFYRNAEVFVFPSLMEGFGFPPLEAMQYGVPVVSSHASCMPEVLGEAAEYCDACDSFAIAEKVFEVLSDTKKQEQMRVAGFEQVKKYSWGRMVRETIGVYDEFLQ
ncbi:MAG: glycosyltransferase family 1 protein [bacterium]